MTIPNLTDLAAGLTGAEREAAMRCGDVADRLPCERCGGKTLRACTVSLEDRRRASDAVNSACAIVNGDGLKALRNHLQQGSDA